MYNVIKPGSQDHQALTEALIRTEEIAAARKGHFNIDYDQLAVLYNRMIPGQDFVSFPRSHNTFPKVVIGLARYGIVKDADYKLVPHTGAYDIPSCGLYRVSQVDMRKVSEAQDPEE